MIPLLLWQWIFIRSATANLQEVNLTATHMTNSSYVQDCLQLGFSLKSSWGTLSFSEEGPPIPKTVLNCLKTTRSELLLVLKCFVNMGLDCYTVDLHSRFCLSMSHLTLKWQHMKKGSRGYEVHFKCKNLNEFIQRESKFWNLEALRISTYWVNQTQGHARLHV